MRITLTALNSTTIYKLPGMEEKPVPKGLTHYANNASVCPFYGMVEVDLGCAGVWVFTRDDWNGFPVRMKRRKAPEYFRIKYLTN